MRVFSDMDQAIPKLNTVLKKRRQQAQKVAGLVMIKLNTRKRWRFWGHSCPCVGTHVYLARKIVSRNMVGVPWVHIGASVLEDTIERAERR